MFERELEQQEEKTLAAERGRSPSEAASVGGPARPPATPGSEPAWSASEVVATDPPPILSPAMEADPPILVTSGCEPPSADGVEAVEFADDAFPNEEPFAEEPFEEPPRKPRLLGIGRGKGRRLAKPQESPQPSTTPEQRLLILDTWQRSGLPAGDFAPLVGVSKHTLYAWKARFEEQGPAGLLDQPRGGPKGSRMPELTKRTILMLKQSNPEWGCQRISDMLLRGPALPASATAVARVLHEAGYQMEEVTTRPHPDKVRQFERATPNQLWQTDLFTFVLKRQNRRVYLVAFMDDNSRFLTGYGLHASQSTALVLEVVRAAIVAYGTPQEMLTDNGSQYVTWRGTSAFHREMDKRGIKHIVAKPQRPQTLGKIERFWGTLWRECIETSVFLDLEDARRRIGHFIDYYNFQRPHQGIGGLVPADRFFGAASEVLQTLRNRVAANALELARNGVPKAPFYVTGRIGDRAFSVHAEGERMILKREGQSRQEVDLTAPDAAPVPLVNASSGPVPSAMPLPVCPGRNGRGELTSASRASGGRDPSGTGREAPRVEQAGRWAGEKNDPQRPTLQETPPQENHARTESLKPMNPGACKPLKRGWPAQRQRREADRAARRRAVAFDRWAHHHGLKRRETAKHLGVAARTLAYWRRQRRKDHLAAHPRGRSCHRGDLPTRNAAIHLMTVLGPCTGLPTLRAVFPTLARAEIQDLQRRYRRLWRRNHRRLLHVLHWHRPGAVWAMDHTDPPSAIDGCWRHILAVRDLASRMQLGWLPVASEDAPRTCRALEDLFRRHGPPLVLKSDNGSAFIDGATLELLDRWGVLALFSPPRRPQYNGSCEAGNGAMETRTAHQAILDAQPGLWTTDGLYTAQAIANHIHRPWGHRGPTAAAVWRQREPITAAQRAAFRLAVARHRAQARTELGYPENKTLDRKDQPRVDRLAIRRACVECGFLTFTRRSITPPIKPHFVANIS